MTTDDAPRQALDAEALAALEERYRPLIPTCGECGSVLTVERHSWFQDGRFWPLLEGWCTDDACAHAYQTLQLPVEDANVLALVQQYRTATAERDALLAAAARAKRLEAALRDIAGLQDEPLVVPMPDGWERAFRAGVREAALRAELALDVSGSAALASANGADAGGGDGDA